MARLARAVAIALLVASCGTAQVASSPAPYVPAATSPAPTAALTIAPTVTTVPATPLSAGPSVGVTATTPTIAAAPTAAATDGPTPVPLPRAIDPTAKPTPLPILTASLAPTATPTFVASATPTTNGSAVRPAVYIVHSADNYMHVQFDRPMRQSGVGAANAFSAYLLDGAGLPAGSTVICGSPTCDVVRIDMPQNLARGSAHTMTVRNVVSVEGAALSPDPTVTPFRTDTTSG